MKQFICLFVVATLTLAAPRPRIIGGVDANQGEFPHQVSYQIEGTHFCGGCILTPEWILTAGHCVYEIPSEGNFTIAAGLTDLDDKSTNVQNIPVVEKIVNPNYKGGVNPNDIALLRLASPLTLTEKVQPIKLPTAGEEFSGMASLSGWGAYMLIFDVLPVMPNTLQKSDVPIVTDAECQSALYDLIGDTPFDAVSNICTGPLSGGHSTCTGDSGGPLIQGNTLIGVVSWGINPCGSVGAPSVYTQVSSFLDFINDTINK